MPIQTKSMGAALQGTVASEAVAVIPHTAGLGAVPTPFLLIALLLVVAMSIRFLTRRWEKRCYVVYRLPGRLSEEILIPDWRR